MVLDIRHLSEESAPVADASPVGPDLDQLLEDATSTRSNEQARAIEELRLLVPSETGVERLFEIAEDLDDRRRLAAIQMLGYHRSWLASPRAMRRIMELAQKERDPSVARALVWALRRGFATWSLCSGACLR